MQSNFVFSIKHVRSLDLLDGTPESPQEHCHKSRGTLRSLHQREIAPCTTNQLEMRPDSPALCGEHIQVPNQTRKEPRFTCWNSRESPRTQSEVYNDMMSLQEGEIVWCTPNNLEMKLDSPALAPEPSRFPHHTRQMPSHPLGNYRDSLRHPSQSRGTPVSAKQLEESSVHPITSRDES